MTIKIEDNSLKTLLLANIITIIVALWQNWDFGTVLIIYLFQSLIIGLFNFIRILTLENFTTEGMTVNNQPVAPTKWLKLFLAFFFAFHYGTFHFVYILVVGLGFIVTAEYNATSISLPILAAVCLVYFVNHAFSFIANREKDMKKQNIGRIMIYPYIRIVPMHLTIIFGLPLSYFFGQEVGLVFFLLLKTGADAMMHFIEHE